MSIRAQSFNFNYLFSITVVEEDLVSTPSASNEYMSTFRNAYPNVEKYLEINFEGPLDYYDAHRRNDILRFMEWAKNEKYASRSISWLADFDRFQKDTIYDVTPVSFHTLIILIHFFSKL